MGDLDAKNEEKTNTVPREQESWHPCAQKQQSGKESGGRAQAGLTAETTLPPPGSLTAPLLLPPGTAGLNCRG